MFHHINQLGRDFPHSPLILKGYRNLKFGQNKRDSRVPNARLEKNFCDRAKQQLKQKWMLSTNIGNFTSLKSLVLLVIFRASLSYIRPQYLHIAFPRSHMKIAPVASNKLKH